MKDNRSRREFMRDSLTTAAVAGGAGACVCGLSGCASKTPQVDEAFIKRGDGQVTLDVARISELSSPGGSVRLTANKHSIVVIRVEEDRFAALSNKCTHFGRPVDYDAAAGHLVCSSFGHSAFGLDGSVLEGPAKEPLPAYPANLKDGQLTISV